MKQGDPREAAFKAGCNGREIMLSGCFHPRNSKASEAKMGAIQLRSGLSPGNSTLAGGSSYVTQREEHGLGIGITNTSRLNLMACVSDEASKKQVDCSILASSCHCLCMCA